MPEADDTVLRTLMDALSTAPNGLSLSMLRRQIGYSTRLHRIVLRLHALSLSKEISLDNGLYWTRDLAFRNRPAPKAPLAVSPTSTDDGPPIIGDPSFIGPVWEPEFALRLWKRGLRIVQQYPAEGFLLDIALLAPGSGCKLDVEVDGRTTHCDRLGRRKVSDIVRDIRLTTAGWVVKRFWVAELMRDMEGCVEQVVALWNQLGKDD